MSITINVERVGDLVSAIGSPAFGSEYYGLFNGVLPCDQCTVFAFRGDQPPDPMVAEGRSAEIREIAQLLATEYVAGAFALDPSLRRDQRLGAPTVHCLRPDEVTNKKYRVRFYDEPHLSHELVIMGQVGDTRYLSSFYRSDREAAFRNSEIETMHGVASFAIKTLQRHLELVGTGQPDRRFDRDAVRASDKRQQTLDHLREALLCGPYRLSEREAVVCAGIILGYTTLGISLNFGISVNTVATHRKRAYRKLGICSQNELFSRYFQLVNQIHSRPALA